MGDFSNNLKSEKWNLEILLSYSLTSTEAWSLKLELEIWVYITFCTHTSVEEWNLKSEVWYFWSLTWLPSKLEIWNLNPHNSELGAWFQLKLENWSWLLKSEHTSTRDWNEVLKSEIWGWHFHSSLMNMLMNICQGPTVYIAASNGGLKSEIWNLKLGDTWNVKVEMWNVTGPNVYIAANECGCRGASL